ncbi:uncharacterized protein [Malus domestica]|uniref:uncharacterized protein n=1 Tax=Malus domestica TaxID=3750 RepID=UPI003974E5AA
MTLGIWCGGIVLPRVDEVHVGRVIGKFVVHWDVDETNEKQRIYVDGLFKRRKNRIKGLADEFGNWLTHYGDIEQLIVKYFSFMFTLNGKAHFDAILNAVPKRVTPEMNRLLYAEYSDIEIKKKSLFHMDPYTASGPDGLPPLFYQKFWDIVASDVPEPSNMTQLRPIALCNVLYKIGAKVIVNRLKGIMDAIMLTQQCASVPGRLISDNSLVASELGHYLHNLRRGKRG